MTESLQVRHLLTRYDSRTYFLLMYSPTEHASENRHVDDGMDLTAVLVFALSVLGWGGLGIFSALNALGLVN